MLRHTHPRRLWLHLLWVALALALLTCGAAGPSRKQRSAARQRQQQQPPPAVAVPSVPGQLSSAAAERAALREQIAVLKAAFEGRQEDEAVSDEEWSRVQQLAGETMQKVASMTERLSSVDSATATITQIQDKLIDMNQKVLTLQSAQKTALEKPVCMHPRASALSCAVVCAR